MDDLILESKSSDELGWLKDQLLKEFSMKDLGEAKIIIGWEIARDFKAGILKIDLKSYIRDLLEFEGMTLCHPTVPPVKA